MVAVLTFIVIGAIAGWLAGWIIRGTSFGLVGNTIVGVLGAVIAGHLFPMVGLSLVTGFAGHVAHAFVGAVVVLLFLSLVRRAL